MGSLYVSDTYLDYEDLYCEQCGDSDWLVGYATTRAEAWELLKDDTSTFDPSLCKGCEYEWDGEYCFYECENYKHIGGWRYEYVMKFLEENWEE
jgi:hypothetical protein